MRLHIPTLAILMPTHPVARTLTTALMVIRLFTPIGDIGAGGDGPITIAVMATGAAITGAMDTARTTGAATVIAAPMAIVAVTGTAIAVTPAPDVWPGSQAGGVGLLAAMADSQAATAVADTAKDY